MSDYLFDREGEPDPEIARLEAMLAPMAYRGAAPRLPRPARRAPAYVVAAAAIALAAALVAVLIGKPWRPRPPSGAVAQWIDTGEAAMRLDVGIGSVELAAHTRARFVAATRHEMQLERGTLTATIHAPPRQFVVRTPRAVVTDLGCAFAITVDAAGRGSVVVSEGRVAVAGGDAREVVVGAGARVELSEAGPGAVSAPAADVQEQQGTGNRKPETGNHRMAPSGAGAHHHVSKKHPATQIAPPSATHPHVTTPQKKDEAPRIQHDALKDLKNSVE
jgi:ferric-dicitrate binding protein FerR (iron transport regulator)